MYRIFTLSILTTLALLAPTQAELMSFSGTESAVFDNPVGGTSQGAGTSTLNFGSQNGSTLSWTGGSFSTTEGQPFSLGRVTLTNGASFNTPSQVTFTVTLGFDQPSATASATFGFPTQIASTARDSEGQLRLGFDAGARLTFAATNCVTYTLELLGLTSSPTWGGGSDAFNVLTASPGETTSAYVWGQLTQEVSMSCCPQTPEPSALLLGAIGIGLLGLRRLRKMTKA